MTLHLLQIIFSELRRVVETAPTTIPEGGASKTAELPVFLATHGEECVTSFHEFRRYQRVRVDDRPPGIRAVLQLYHKEDFRVFRHVLGYL